MKHFFKFLYNVARTISLFIVLGLIAIIIYGYYTGDLQKALEQEKDGQAQEEIYTKQVSPEKTPGKETRPITDEKLAILADRSTHFIRPDQTAYFSTLRGRVIAVTSEKDTIFGIRSSLSSIFENLSDRGYDTFFKTQNTLINCRYVRQYLPQNMAGPGRSNYVYHLIMETGDTIIIPKDKAQSFLKMMDEFSVSVD